MVARLVDYIKTYDDALDPSFCKQVITQFNLDIKYQKYIDREQRPSFTEMNISERYLDGDDLWKVYQTRIQNTFVEYVNKYMDELKLGPDFPPRYTFEQYRIKKYTSPYDQFKDHVDVQDHSSARRFLVCFLYLNTVLEGGNTTFPKLGETIQPKCGRILLFPATWMYRHSGDPLPRGSKYIVGSYLHYL